MQFITKNFFSYDSSVESGDDSEFESEYTNLYDDSSSSDDSNNSDDDYETDETDDNDDNDETDETDDTSEEDESSSSEDEANNYTTTITSAENSSYNKTESSDEFMKKYRNYLERQVKYPSNPIPLTMNRMASLGDPFRGDPVILPPNYEVSNPIVNPSKDLRRGVFQDQEERTQKLKNISSIMNKYY